MGAHPHPQQQPPLHPHPQPQPPLHPQQQPPLQQQPRVGWAMDLPAWACGCCPCISLSSFCLRQGAAAVEKTIKPVAGPANVHRSSMEAVPSHSGQGPVRSGWESQQRANPRTRAPLAGSTPSHRGLLGGGRGIRLPLPTTSCIWMLLAQPGGVKMSKRPPSRHPLRAPDDSSPGRLCGTSGARGPAALWDRVADHAR